MVTGTDNQHSDVDEEEARVVVYDNILQCSTEMSGSLDTPVSNCLTLALIIFCFYMIVIVDL